MESLHPRDGWGGAKCRVQESHPELTSDPPSPLACELGHHISHSRALFRLNKTKASETQGKRAALHLLPLHPHTCPFLLLSLRKSEMTTKATFSSGLLPSCETTVASHSPAPTEP